MVKWIRLSTFMLLPFVGFSQTHHFDWALSWGGNDSQQAKKVTTDNSGNTYVLGEFNNSGDFDPSAGTFTLSDVNSGTSVFLSKFDQNGTFIWSKLVASGNNSKAVGLTTDASGNVYYCGVFMNLVDFNPGTATSNFLTNGSDDLYFSKIDANGNYLYTKVIGGNDDEVATGILVVNNRLFITGNFTGSLDLDPSTGYSPVITPNPGTNAFVACFMLDGTFNWGKNIAAGSGVNSSVEDITADASGNVYLTGKFNGTCDFNADGSSPISMTSMGSGPNAFVSKWTDDGIFVWTKQFGSTYLSGSAGKRIRFQNNTLYISGEFTGNCYFDMSNQSVHNLTGSTNGFLCKLDTNGNNDSEFNIGAIPMYMNLDQSGNVFFEGVSGANSDVDPGPGTNTLPAYTMYLTQYGPVGNLLGVRTFSGPVLLYDFTVGADNSLLTVGRFTNTVDFNLESGTFNLTSGGSYDAFLQKMNYCASLTQGVDVVQTVCSSYTWIDGNTYTASNNTAIVTLTNAAGCDSIVTLNLTITPAAITQNSNGSLTASSGQSYQWINCATNTPISGQTGQTFTPVANGNYAVIVTSSACSDTSACFAVTNLGLEDFNQPVVVTIYPNPSADGIFTLSTTAVYDRLNVAVFSLDGKKISEKVWENTQQFNLEIEEADGVYLVELSAGTGLKSTYRIIKKK